MTDDQFSCPEPLRHTEPMAATTISTAERPMSAANAEQILARLATVMDILRGWIWETDADHRFTYMSENVERFAGHPPEWHYGKTRQELGNLNPDVEEHRKYLAQLDARVMFGPVEFVRYQNGLQLWMRTIGLPQFDREGQFRGYCGIAFDVTNEIERRQGNRRSEPRRRVARSATISAHDAPSPVPCVVLDISNGGARLDVHHLASIPQRFRLVIDLEGTERTCQVVWRRENSVGVKFINTMSAT